jgi:ABC-2 type transport system permease protein
MTRPFQWSVRRELWENRSAFVVPLSAAALFLFGYSISLFTLPHRLRAAVAAAPLKERIVLVGPFGGAAAVVIVSAYLVGVFYCLDALYGERRDRSILFWKSLPVSDRTTVLAKAAIPLVVLPLVAYVVALATQGVMLGLTAAVLLAAGLDGALLWRTLPAMALTMAYGLAVHALWHAPVYGWLLLVSSWARRVPFLWAVLPPLGLVALEGVAFQTTHVCHLFRHRLIGAVGVAFSTGQAGDAAGQSHSLSLSSVDPLRFLLSPGLWTGLIAAAVFLALAVRLRRSREPS